MSAATLNQRQQPHSSFLHAEFAAGVTACLRSWSALRTAVESGWGGGQRESERKADLLRQGIIEMLNGTKQPVYSTPATGPGGVVSPSPTSASFALAVSSYDVHDLEDNLAIFLEEEFSVNLEDDSERQVAATIFQLYERCWVGDSAMAHTLMEQAIGSKKLGSQLGLPSKPTIQSVNGEDDEDDEDSDNEMMDDDDDDDQMNMQDGDDDNGGPMTNDVVTEVARISPLEYASQPVFGRGGLKPTRDSNSNVKPIRQLGEPEQEMEQVAEVDEDGFAPVKPKGRRNK
jgi:pre-rRNA-processing protein TSR2